jgi:GNAT superfamily N-acetyltransferase
MHVREAIPADNEELQALQARCPMGTNLIVSTVNAPDFFSRAKAYENYKVFVACEDGAIVGSAACGVRNAMVNGEPRRVGYEFQAFTAPEHRRKGVAVQLHQHREEYIRDQGCVLSYTLIMEDNVPAMRYIEGQGFARHRTLLMPGLAVHRKMKVAAAGEIRPMVPEDLAAVAALLSETWRGCELYEPASAEALARFIDRTPAYDLDSVLILRDRDDILACLGFWDWSRITRITVLSLSRKMRMLGLLLNVARLLRPMPRSPRPGDTLKQMVLAPIGFREPKHLAALLRHLNNESLAKGIEHLFCICEPGRALLGALQGFVHIDTAMHLYTKPLQPGIALGSGPVFIGGTDL